MIRLDDLLVRASFNAVALIERDRVLTYAALNELVSSVATGLLSHGIEQGDRVAIWLGKTVEAVALSFAISRAGGVLVPINPVLRVLQVAHILDDSGAKLLVTNRARRDALANDSEIPPTTILTVEDDWVPLTQNPELPTVPAADLAAILYTSGSTGRPKGVMLSHANLLLGAKSVAGYLGHGNDDRILCVLPLSFDAGFSQLTTAFYVGATAVLLDFLTPRDVVKAVERHRITHITAVPPLWMQLVDADWPDGARQHLRSVASTGGKMPVTLTDQVKAVFPVARIFLMYGLTEAFRSTYLDPQLINARPDSIGRAIPDAEILVLRPDGSETAPDEPGELVHAGPLVAQGYWGDTARTGKRFRPAPSAAKSGGAAVWSGDTVRRDADGFLYFVARADEMIKTNGYRVSPTEIEDAAYSTGAVSEAVALGIPDQRLGQAIMLIARASAGVASEQAEAILRGELAATLPTYMLPREIHWLDHLPRSANGKLDRAALRQEFA